MFTYYTLYVKSARELDTHTVTATFQPTRARTSFELPVRTLPRRRAARRRRRRRRRRTPLQLFLVAGAGRASLTRTLTQLASPPAAPAAASPARQRQRLRLRWAHSRVAALRQHGALARRAAAVRGKPRRQEQRRSHLVRRSGAVLRARGWRFGRRGCRLGPRWLFRPLCPKGVDKPLFTFY